MSASKWKQYSESKNIGYKWLESIPTHWDICRLKHFSYIKGRVGWHGLNSDDFIDEGPFLVTGSDFVHGKINWSNCYHVSKEKYDMDPYIQLQEGDLLITKDGTIGKLAIVRDMPGLATLNSGVFVIRPKRDKYRSEYMYYVLQSDLFHGFNDYNKYGSTIDHLYQHTFGNMPFTAPTLGEQEKIAAFLRDSLVSIDKAIEGTKRGLEILDEKRSALITQAVTKGLDSDVPMKDSEIDWIGEIPKHWKVIRLGMLELDIQTGPFGSQLHSADYVIGGTPILNATHLKGGQISPEWSITADEDTVARLSQHKLLAKDLIFGRRGEAARVAEVSKNEEGWLCGTGSIRVRIIDSKIHSKFLTIYCGSSISAAFFERDGGRTTMLNLNEQMLKNLVCPLPPYQEQNEIADYIDEQCQLMNNIREKTELRIEKLKEYRTALIQAAVTGKIDVCGL